MILDVTTLAQMAERPHGGRGVNPRTRENNHDERHWELANDAAARTLRVKAVGPGVSTYRLGAEEYGIDILGSRRSAATSRRPRSPTPAFIKGVVNPRRSIVPIVDMRIKFDVGHAGYDQFTMVIILNVGGRVVGMVVDSVSDVTSPGTTIRPAPTSPPPSTPAHHGPGHPDGRMLILMDIDAADGLADMALIDQAVH
ncbi:MAG: chemotaxis protein CheW [Sulfuritalea sp.]|nr:chemotaxis protein CheW [Sulfuritalea sp.]